jgi:glycerophosphoryl diester phosphodiesterase
MTARFVVQVAVAVVLIFVAPGVGRAEWHRTLEGTVDLLLGLDVRPFAIAHRGFGENLGADRSRPIEDTVAAVQKGFRAGASVVEVDVQLTRDGRVAVFHDDVLPDLTCLNRLTLAELQARLPQVPTLEAVLAAARHFNQASDPLRGIVIVELKAAAPLCDRADTQEHAIVSAVTQVIRHMRMTHQVMLTSFSPALLYLAHRDAPETERILAVSGLQFLTKEEIEAALGQPVTLIDKGLDLGLQWAELGNMFRLPGYRSFHELFETAALTGARVVEADLLLLHSAGAPLVQTLHAAGLKVFGFTANTTKDWNFLESLGVDGIYTNDVRMGVRRQAPIP